MVQGTALAHPGFGVASIPDRIAKVLAAGRAREVGQVTALPAGVPEVSIDQLESMFGSPWYKKWWVWAIAGTVAAGGVFLLIRRRRRKRS